MFDVSFSELVLILVVGLIVFGPEKLPEVVRTTGMWIAKMKRSFTHMRSEIEREIGVDEIKRDIHNNTIMQNLRDVQNDLQRTQRELQNLPYDVNDVVQRANTPSANAETSAEVTTSPATEIHSTTETSGNIPHDNSSTQK